MSTASLPTAGSPAPDFTVATDTGARVSLADFRGKPVVLYFYPKDDTPGCTVEACEFRDLFPKFRSLDAVVLGVSPDDVASHVKFRDKFTLPFTLLADDDHAIAEAYGVWAEKRLFAHKYWGNLRTTFVIDREGRVARVFEKVKPEGHAAEVAEVVAGLG